MLLVLQLAILFVDRSRPHKSAMMATGMISIMALPSNTGAANPGVPIHAALAMPERSSGLPRPMPFARTA